MIQKFYILIFEYPSINKRADRNNADIRFQIPKAVSADLYASSKVIIDLFSIMDIVEKAYLNKHKPR